MAIDLKIVILWVEYSIAAIGLVVLAYGVLDSTFRLVKAWLKREDIDTDRQGQESVRKHLGSYILLALEYFIAADILRTIVKPSWEEVGVLAAIVGIRTVLSLVLNVELKYFK